MCSPGAEVPKNATKEHRHRNAPHASPAVEPNRAVRAVRQGTFPVSQALQDDRLAWTPRIWVLDAKAACLVQYLVSLHSA